MQVDVKIVTVNKAPHGRAPDYFWFRTEFLRQKKLLIQNAETDGIKKKKIDILKSNKQIIISVA